jgi:hypothetical protein
LLLSGLAVYRINTTICYQDAVVLYI